MHDPRVPETLEGWSILHEMFRVRWPEIRKLSQDAREALAAEASAVLRSPGSNRGYTGPVHLLGHKADLMIIHFRSTFEELGAMELKLAQTGLYEYLERTTSYVSIVELGLYEMTAKIHQQLAARNLKPESDEFDQAFNAEIERQRKRMMGRLFSEIPNRRYVCFYPMNKKRGEQKNWYTEPYERRSEMMLEHGIVGRRYSGQVTQIISGSIGFDDWEWGVDLFADDPLTFKKLIYEMRFDEASAIFAEFGPFYTGLQFDPAELHQFLSGRVSGLGSPQK